MNNMIALSWPYQVRTFSFHKWDEWIPLKTKLSPFSRAVDHFWKAVDRYVKPYHCSMCTNDCFMIKIHVQLLMVACSQNSLFSLMGKKYDRFSSKYFHKRLFFQCCPQPQLSHTVHGYLYYNWRWGYTLYFIF